MPRVFVSFRKVDDRLGRDRVYRALVEAFGTEQVFKSGPSIEPGTDYAQTLMSQAAGCEVMLVLIGADWLDASDPGGERLLARERDWVRREIATSFQAGNHVIPVLLGEATMLPAAEDLPPDLARLARLQFVRIAESRPRAGLEQLVSTLRRLLPELDPAPAGARSADRATTRPANQTAEATGGSIAINVGGNLHADRARFIGGDRQGE